MFAVRVELREAIVDYLRISRGIDCQPEQVFITHACGLVALILHALASRETDVIEDPAFTDLPDCHLADVEILPVRLMTMDGYHKRIQNYPLCPDNTSTKVRWVWRSLSAQASDTGMGRS